MADEAAEEGVQLLGPEVVLFGHRLAARHKSYTTFTRQLQGHIAFMYKVRAILIGDLEQSIPPQQRTHQPTNQPPLAIMTIPPHDTHQHQPRYHLTQIILAE